MFRSLPDDAGTIRHSLLTSAAAAQALRVGVSSIKRWTDEGALDAVRTPGGHRRYTLAALHHFARLHKLDTDRLPPLEQFETLPPPPAITLLEALRGGDVAAVRRLITPAQKSIGLRAAYLDRVVGDTLREMGELWRDGKLTIDEEHRGSHVLAAALDELRPAITDSARLAILACPPGELHDLPLRLVRLVMEWAGWRTDFLGASMPWTALEAALSKSTPSTLVLSGRTAEPFRTERFEQFLAWCRENGIRVVAGGEWARGGSGNDTAYLRFRTLKGFARWLNTDPSS